MRLAAASMSVSVDGSGSKSRIVGSRKRRHLVDADAAPGEHARDDVGHAMSLRDGQRRHLLALVQPVLPGKPGHRPPDAEEVALLDDHAAIERLSMGAG